MTSSEVVKRDGSGLATNKSKESWLGNWVMHFLGEKKNV